MTDRNPAKKSKTVQAVELAIFVGFMYLTYRPEKIGELEEWTLGHLDKLRKETAYRLSVWKAYQSIQNLPETECQNDGQTNE